MTKKEQFRLAQNSAVISGIFCIMVALLLLLNYLQVSKSDPIESKALEALVERLSEEPRNEELKSEIRNFDLLARKAYFNSRWQIKTGSYLLLFGAIVLAVSLRIYYSLKSKIEKPDKVLEDEISGRILARKGILIAGALVILLAFAASLATVNYLDTFGTGGADPANAPLADEEDIEVIDVGETAGESSADRDMREAEGISLQETDEDQDPVREDTPEEGQGIQPDESLASAPAGDKDQKQAPAEGKTASADVSSGPALEQIRANYNGFRGPLGQGVVFQENIPTEWDGTSGKNILWKSAVPKHGYNSPVVWGDKVFIAGADEQSREIYCYDGNSGELLWTGVAGNIPGSPETMPNVTEDTGLSAPTLTTDGKRVFAIFGTGDVIAFDMNGNRLWAKNLGVPDNHYGHSSSLIIWGKKLFIQYDTNENASVRALDVESGEVIWETNRDANISWASPVLAEVEGKYQLILTADPIVAGYDVGTGKELWAVDCMMGEVGPSVGFSDGIVYAANEYATMVAIDIKTQEILWEDNYYLPEASSLLAHDGLLIVCTSYGVIACYDAKSGEMHWEDDVGTTFYSSPITAEGKLFIMDNDGVMRIYNFSGKKELISENKLGETSGTTPAFVEGRIYIRGQDYLYCIGTK